MENLVIVRFDQDAKAYQALTEIKTLSATGAFLLHEAAVVVAQADGSLEIKDSVGLAKTDGTDTGSLIGLLVGILGGPFGMLLGWLAGSAIGASVDADDAAGAAAALAWVGRAMAPGSTGTIAIVDEPTPDVIDAMATRLGGSVDRVSADAVHDALESAQQADFAARAAAAKSMLEASAKARRAKWDELKEKALHLFSSHPTPKQS
jgi:uncharacterized membrane protein